MRASNVFLTTLVKQSILEQNLNFNWESLEFKLGKMEEKQSLKFGNDYISERVFIVMFLVYSHKKWRLFLQLTSCNTPFDI